MQQYQLVEKLGLQLAKRAFLGKDSKGPILSGIVALIVAKLGAPKPDKSYNHPLNLACTTEWREQQYREGTEEKKKAQQKANKKVEKASTQPIRFPTVRSVRQVSPCHLCHCFGLILSGMPLVNRR